MKDRIDLLDALRGLALAGIVAVHFMEQYLGAMPPAAYRNYSQVWPIDGLLEAVGFLLIRGKGFAIFSFMFGLSFALQMQRAERRAPDRDFRPRFAWRLLILLVIGWLHSLVYGGDILMIYAALGWPLMLFYRVAGRWLWAAALVLMLGLPRIGLLAAYTAPSAARRQAVDARLETDAQRYFQAAKHGPVSELVRLNATQGLRNRVEYQFGIFSRGYQTFAYFLLGLWAGRRRLFELAEENRLFFRRLLKWGAAVTVGLPLLMVALTVAARAAGVSGGGGSGAQGPQDLYAWPVVFGLCVYDLWNFGMTLAFIGAFVLLFLRPRWRRWLVHLAPVGRMALTSYLVQSAVGATLFLSFGLGLVADLGNAVTLPLAVALFMVQMGASRLWLERFHYGPVEWLWRSLTFLRVQRFRREGPAPSPALVTAPALD